MVVAGRTPPRGDAYERVRHGIVAALVLSTHVAVSCSSSDAGGSGGRACERELSGQCGDPCATTVDCPRGQYCAGDTCIADCTPSGTQCGSGQTCGTDGRCVELPGGGFGGNVNTQDGSCLGAEVRFEQQTPTVMLLIDRSGSMLDDFDGGTDRWNSIRDTLVGGTNSIVARLERKVRFGLMLYTSVNGNQGGACPLLVEVDPAIQNFERVRDVFDSTEIMNRDDDTPTAESLAAAEAALLEFSEPGQKVIVLATDGEPDTCADPDAHNDNTNTMSVRAVERAFENQIPTYVISVGDEVGEDHLQDLANAGAGVTSGATAYRALDAGALVDAFEAIIRGVVSCEFELNGEVQSGSEATGRVVLDGEELVYGDEHGWELSAPDTIRLLGDACERAKTSSDSLSIDFPSCGSFVIE